MATYDQTRHGYTLRLTITETATNVETNTSTITYKLQLISGNQYHFEQFGVGATITIDGTTVASRSRDNDPYLTIGFNSTLTLLSGSTTVTHAADGTKTLSLGYTLNMADYYYTPGPMSGTGSFVCATIPRATTPTLSASSVNIGSAVTISVSGRASSSFSHVLSYTIGSASGSIATLNTSTTSYSWTVPAIIADQLPNTTTGTLSITCTTMSGSTTVGSKNVSLTVKVPNNSTFQPSISSFAVTENNATVSGLNLGSSYLVQGKSNITISGTATAKRSATIRTTTYKVGNTTVSSPSNIAINTIGSLTIQMSVTDSRGYSTTSSTTKTSLAYSSPQVYAMNFYRSTSGGTQDGSGTYLHYTFTGSITSLNSKNANTWSLQYQRTGTSTWTNIASGTGYTLNVSGTSSSGFMDVNYSYNIRLTLTDSFGSSSFTQTISTGYTTVDYRNTGKGIAFGKASEIDAFECNMNEALYGNILFDNGVQTEERRLQFKNDSNSANYHYATIYGGNPSSTTTIGIYDVAHNHSALYYLGGTGELGIMNTADAINRGDVKILGTSMKTFLNWTLLTMTRTDNSYVDATSFGRLSAFKRSGFLWLNLNLSVSNVPVLGSMVEIGRISGWSAVSDNYITMAAQSGSGVLLVGVTYDGVISIGNGSGTTINGFCRGQVMVPAYSV